MNFVIPYRLSEKDDTLTTCINRPQMFEDYTNHTFSDLLVRIKYNTYYTGLAFVCGVDCCDLLIRRSF